MQYWIKLLWVLMCAGPNWVLDPAAARPKIALGPAG